MNNKQTSVDFYMKSSFDLQNAMAQGTITRLEYIRLHEEMYIKATAMHKEEILDAVDWGNRKGYDEHKLTCIYDDDKKYYNEVYGNDKQ
jgi:hypothetical protein